MGFDCMLEEHGTSGFGYVEKQLMLDTGRLHVYRVSSEAFFM